MKLFIKISGYCYGKNHSCDNIVGFYWSTISCLSYSKSAFNLGLKSESGIYPNNYSDRYHGFQIRNISM